MPGLLEGVPRDDRAWPRTSRAVSVVLLLVAVGSGVALVFGAAARGSRGVAVVAVAVGAAFGFGLAVSVPGMRRWIAGQAFPAPIQLLQGAGFVVGLVVLFWVDGPVGGALLAGLFGSVFAVNLWGIRTARANRDVVDAAEAALARDQAAAPDDGRPVPVPPGAVADRAPVGRVLRDLVAVQRRRALGWLLASALGIAACVVLPVPAEATIAVVCVGPLFFLWDLRRLWAVWLALRDFRKGATSPRRAFVVLLHDPAPRMVRPLLGVWSQAPAQRGGRLPKPEQVYRCDEDRDDLESFQGDVVVHEAWVDTGPRRWSKPRWLAADAGVAVPHRRAVLGRWYLSSLLSGERPELPRQLTQPPPRPDDEVIMEMGQAGGSLPAAVASRLAGLAALGLLFWWLA